MIDTHCHLNFSVFRKTLDAVIQDARQSGVEKIIVPGTDIKSSKKAVEIAEKYEEVYAAVGVHPHHAYETKIQNLKCKIKKCNLKLKIIHLLSSKKVVAIGEVGLDYYKYTKTKYESYVIDDNVKKLQKELFIEQIKLAIQYNKSLIIHNREAREDVLEILREYWNVCLEGQTVFHCCEPDYMVLDFAIKHHIFIGVDGDVTFNKEKQEFVKKIPLDLLVLETDSPFLLPEPLRSQKKYPNEPKNIVLIHGFIAELLKMKPEVLSEKTTQNAKRLFNFKI